MVDKENGWGEWSRHVLAELVRLNGNFEALSKAFTTFKMDVTKERLEDKAEWTVALAISETKAKFQARAWSAIIGVALSLVTFLLVKFLGG